MTETRRVVSVSTNKERSIPILESSAYTKWLEKLDTYTSCCEELNSFNDSGLENLNLKFIGSQFGHVPKIMFLSETTRVNVCHDSRKLLFNEQDLSIR